MTNRIKILIATGGISFLTACASPTIDTSSPENMQGSVQSILNDLSQEQQTEFTRIMINVYKQSMMKTLDEDISFDEAKREADQKVNGLNANDIFKLGRSD